MKLFLVRHGETPWNRDNLIMDRSNPSLSTLGQVQAKALGRVLGQLDDVEAIYSSPLARTMETAKAISLPLGFPVNIHEGLAELDIGPLEGMTSEERLINYPEFSSQWAHDPTTAVLSDVESLSHLQERAWDAIQIPLSTTDDSAIIVSHFFPILLLLCKFLDIPINKYRGLRVDLASISTIHIQDGRSRLLMLNDRCHLYNREGNPYSL